MSKSNLFRYSEISFNTIKRYLFGINRDHNIKYLTYEMTNECNSKCEMCNIWANKKNDKILKTKEVIDFFNDKALRNLKEVILTGGELFMRDDIPKIVESIWKINKKTIITLSTNGILYEKILSNAEDIARQGIPVNYGISLDGLGEDHNHRRRIENNFEIIDEKLIPGLKKLNNKFGNISIGIGHCLDEYGSKTFEQLKEYCENKKISFMSQLIEDFDYYLPEKKQKKISNQWEGIHFMKVGSEGKNRLLKKDIYSKNSVKYTEMISKLPTNIHHLRMINFLSDRAPRYECSSFRNFFLLKYDGAITPCLRFSTQELGNIKNESLSSILDKNDRKKAVDEILKCEGCLNTWCTEWSMQENVLPFKKEAARLIIHKFKNAFKLN